MKNRQKIKGSQNNMFNNQGGGNQIINLENDKGPVVDRESSKPFLVFGKRFKIKWLFITGIVTFIADLLTITIGFKQYFNGSQSVYYLFCGLLLVMMLTMSLYIAFRSGAMLRLGGKNIVARDGILNEEVYSYPPCPECGGKLFLTSDKQVGYVLACSIYPHLASHRYAFSPKIFDNKSY